LSIAQLRILNLEQLLSKHYATSFNQDENVCKYCEKIYPSLYYNITDTNIVLKKTFEDKQLLSSELQEFDDSNTNISKSSKTTKKKWFLNTDNKVENLSVILYIN